METFEMKTFRLGAVYGAPPIFNPDVDEIGYVKPSDLHVSPHLLAQLDEWNDEFQQTFSDDYPPDSGFNSEDDRKRHNTRGAELATLLQQELGAGVRIEFIPLR
ncbi:hypothetical protein [Paraburkholderia mimosarum]|uniref:hypothetical protein n=1 Tax=Paraburkholderia mimosarum TaxID=312026 RepID=UPI0012DCE403|nr:hypothetical protein [Paraburkholderia mimosarum]